MVEIIQEEFTGLVAGADPLNLDESLRLLPFFNNGDRVDPLTKMISAGLSYLREHPVTDKIQALAATRDLGMLAASMRRRGLQPVNIIPGLEDGLLKLSAISGEVPRDTVFTYGVFNPQDERMRRFTSLDEEVVFIRSFTKGMSRLDTSIWHLRNLRDLDTADPVFQQNVDEAGRDFSLMICAIVEVYRNIPPEVFTYKLRPYFEPLKVGGREYLGPGGAQMPVLLVDLLLWGSDCVDSTYRDYVEENIIYTTEGYRRLADEVMGQPSLVTLISKGLGNREKTHQDGQSLGVLISLFNRMIAFRSPHLVVAKQNFQLRNNGDVGSGGYNPQILEYLIEKTKQGKQTLMQLQE